ncbi:MAG: 4-hydroxy-tetrahydrodipicolinate synthase [Armatimonadetes bacterium]|nr:4-hydroxy-tetrahydrodipicolinate synthase [Armatimonadota bacterium]
MPFEPKGVFAPNITPFSAQSVDEPALRRVLDYLIEGNAGGLVPCGTTGESATLTHDEHRRVIEMTIEHAAGRVPVIAGTGSNSTAEAIELTKHAEDAGADAALLICPYYNRPTQDGLIAHFTQTAEATSLPLIMYNIPSRTGVNMTAATTAVLSRVPNIVGIKEASGDLQQVAAIIEQADPDFAVLSGDGNLTFLICCLGGAGAILADAHILPAEWRRMVELIAAGNIADAREIHYRLLPITRALFLETNPAPVKVALELMGIASADTRLPLLPATDRCRTAMREELGKLGLL